MKKKYFPVLFYCLLAFNASCQTQLNISARLNKYISSDNSSYEFTTLEYCNVSQGDILVWVDFSLEKDESLFFKEQKGDFSLRSMIYDNILNSNNMKIGESFMKILKPTEKMRFHLFKCENQVENKIQFENFVKTVELLKIIKTYKFNPELIPSYIGFDVFVDCINTK